MQVSLQGWKTWTMLAIAAVLLAGGSPSTPAFADPGDPPAAPKGGAGNGLIGPLAAPASAPGPLTAVPLGGPWQEFAFGAVGSFATGCTAACAPSSGGNSVYAGAPPWTFTGPAVLRVTDAFLIGDRFEVLDSNVSVGSTDAAAAAGECGSDPVPCYGNPAVSQGVFSFGPGSHSVTIKVLASPSGDGAAYFRLDAPSCTLDQTLSYSGGELSFGWTLGTNQPATWQVYVVVGAAVLPLVSALPVPAVDPPVTVGPYSVAVPPLGVVGMLTTLVTPSGGLICSDWDTVDTGSPPAGAVQAIDLAPLNLTEVVLP